MWITGDVNLPDALLDAYERGELVFFVGAGASVSPPSGLPLFNKLAQKLAVLAYKDFDESIGLDYFIGKLEAADFDAHKQTIEIISDQNSKPNKLHEAIVTLAGNSPKFRVVTTNYDFHLASAAARQAISVPDVWNAPALPIGSDFTGIVHLHGSVNKPEAGIVLTDHDFGAAYITNRWATRFLISMFARYTVVFIGYSHDDTIMRYLALGLSSSKTNDFGNRYVFTDNDKDEKWGYLGIEPIAYPSDNDHVALSSALTSWARLAKMKETDHKSRLRAIIKGGRILSAPDSDYLQARLLTLQGVNDFLTETKLLPDKTKLEWLAWLEDKVVFKEIFLLETRTETASALSRWFASTFISSATLNGAALKVLQQNGQSMSTDLFQAAVDASNTLYQEDESAGTRWLSILSTSIKGHTIGESLKSFAYLAQEARLDFATLRAVLKPFLKLETPLFAEESNTEIPLPKVEINWLLGEHELSRLLKCYENTSIASSHTFRRILEDSLCTACDLLNAYEGDSNSDTLSFHRSAIEPHEQDRFRKPVDAIIDALRDNGHTSLDILPNLPDLWWETGYPLMRRLAIHLVSKHSTWSSDEKILWLLDRTNLYEFAIKHETYELLASVLPSASPSVKNKVLQTAQNGPNLQSNVEDIDRHAKYCKYNLLAWLAMKDEAWKEGKEAFNEIQSANPDFSVREHPDLDFWVYDVSWGEEMPLEVDEFVAILNEAPEYAISVITSSEETSQNQRKLSKDVASTLVKQTVLQYPALGINLWHDISNFSSQDSKNKAILRSIVEGWSYANLGNINVQVVEILKELAGDSYYCDQLAYFLLNQIRQENLENTPHIFNSMRELAQSLWTMHSEEFTYSQDTSPLSLAPLYLNSWPGFLAQYWSHEITRRWTDEKENWSGLNDVEKESLKSLISGSSPAQDATQPAIAGALSFYFSADAEFAITNILPIFDNPERHLYGWYPFLHHARVNNRLLKEGFFNSILTEVDRFHELPKIELKTVFFSLVISVLSHASISNSERDELLNKISATQNDSTLSMFANAVARFLGKDSHNGEEIWKLWLKKHIQRRLNGLPRKISAEEIENWADIVPYVGQFIPEAVTLFETFDVAIGKKTLLLTIPDEALRNQAALLVDFFAHRIVNTSNTDSTHLHRIPKFISQLESKLGKQMVLPLIDAAKQRGFLEESN